MQTTLRTEIINATPAKTKKFCEHSAPNRFTQPLRVKMFKEIIEDGMWELHHQGIAFDEEGRLVDGLHRCTAISQGGIAVPIMATWGLPKKALNAVDLGKSRDPADIVNITGATPERVTKTMTAVARAMIEGFSNTASGRLNQQKVIRLMVQHFDAIAFCRKHGGGLAAYIQAPVARAWYTKDRDRLAEFLMIVKAGTSESSRDQAAAKLAFAHKGIKGHPRSNERAVWYRKTEAALQNFLQGGRLSSLCEVKKEQFLIPESE